MTFVIYFVIILVIVSYEHFKGDALTTGERKNPCGLFAADVVWRYLQWLANGDGLPDPATPPIVAPSPPRASEQTHNNINSEPVASPCDPPDLNQRQKVGGAQFPDFLPTPMHSTEQIRRRAASNVEPDELWAEPNNGGKAQDQHYIEAHRCVRNQIVDAFCDGRLYSHGYDSFCTVIKQQHAFLAKSGTHCHNFTKSEIGQFRTIEIGRRYNNRFKQSVDIVPTAERYNDPYGMNHRFEPGPRDNNLISESIVKLPGINYDDLPRDFVSYQSNGELVHGSEKYVFYYPLASAVEQYVQAAYKLGAKIELGIKQGGDSTKVLNLIALQYQYLANARPFANINNSLFMHIVNTQVKLLGFKGMTHGDMDIAAQRLQPAAFARYFVDRATGHND